MSDEIILSHLLEQTQTLGQLTQGQDQINQRLAMGDQDLKEIKTELKTKATKEDVYELADAAVRGHIQADHPSRAEEIGQQVLNIWDQLWNHKKITIGTAGALTLAILKLSGVG